MLSRLSRGEGSRRTHRTLPLKTKENHPDSINQLCSTISIGVLKRKHVCVLHVCLQSRALPTMRFFLETAASQGYVWQHSLHQVAYLQVWRIAMMTKINKNNFRAMKSKKSLALNDLGPWAWNKISGLGIGPCKVEGSRNKNPPHILLYLIIMYPKDVSLTFSTPSLPAAPTMTNANLPLHNLLRYQATGLSSSFSVKYCGWWHSGLRLSGVWKKISGQWDLKFHLTSFEGPK